MRNILFLTKQSSEDMKKYYNEIVPFLEKRISFRTFMNAVNDYRTLNRIRQLNAIMRDAEEKRLRIFPMPLEKYNNFVEELVMKKTEGKTGGNRVHHIKFGYAHNQYAESRIPCRGGELRRMRVTYREIGCILGKNRLLLHYLDSRGTPKHLGYLGEEVKKSERRKRRDCIPTTEEPNRVATVELQTIPSIYEDDI